MFSYKKFTFYILAVPVFFFTYNAVVWKLVTEDLMSNKNSDGGDLVRLGYLPDLKSYRKNSNDLPRRHLEDDQYKGEPIDVVTIGDSFSNGGGGGKNRYYQDYLASINGFSVLNIEPYLDIEYLTLASCLANNGFLDKVKPRYLLISSSERMSIDKFSVKVDFDENMSMEKLAGHQRFGYRLAMDNSQALGKKSFFNFINEGNFKYLLYKICYHFSDNAFFSKTYKKSLSSPLFSIKKSNTLLFLRDDLRSLSNSSQNRVAALNNNLNMLADKLAKKGIKLYFMPCADKYDVYSQFIINNKYPKSTFFELLRPLPKRYTFIDTKAILLPEIQRGVKDIYHADDTHWSWKASEKIFQTVKFD